MVCFWRRNHCMALLMLSKTLEWGLFFALVAAISFKNVFWGRPQREFWPHGSPLFISLALLIRRNNFSGISMFRVLQQWKIGFCNSTNSRHLHITLSALTATLSHIISNTLTRPSCRRGLEFLKKIKFACVSLKQKHFFIFAAIFFFSWWILIVF